MKDWSKERWRKRYLREALEQLWWRASHPKVFAGTSPPAAYAKTATESRLTFLMHRAKLAIVFALLKALLGALLAAMKPRASLVAKTWRFANSSQFCVGQVRFET